MFQRSYLIVFFSQSPVRQYIYIYIRIYYIYLFKRRQPKKHANVHLFYTFVQQQQHVSDRFCISKIWKALPDALRLCASLQKSSPLRLNEASNNGGFQDTIPQLDWNHLRKPYISMVLLGEANLPTSWSELLDLDGMDGICAGYNMGPDWFIESLYYFHYHYDILINWWYSIVVSCSFRGDWQRSCKSFHCPFSGSSFYNSLFFLGMVGGPGANAEFGGFWWVWMIKRWPQLNMMAWEARIDISTEVLGRHWLDCGHPWGVGGMPSTLKLGEVSGKCRTNKNISDAMLHQN